MCLIIDADSVAAVFADKTPKNFVPIIEWLTAKNGMLVIGGKLSEEIDKVDKAKRFVRALSQAGHAKLISSALINKDAEEVRTQCKSNDNHVIALARISGARLLCSHDKELHKDFRNVSIVPEPRGHIYQTAKHKDLLRLYGHTAACGV
jgi:hypothetical protein